jgi:NADH-quinone oxidoreductase subunit N
MTELLRQEFGQILPELFVSATILCVLLSELLFGGDDEYEELRVSDFVALIGLLVALAVTLLGFRTSMDSGQAARYLFGATLAVDPFSQFIKILLLLSTLFAVLFSYQTPEVTTPRRAEYIAYLLCLLVGGMFLASANDILMMYLAFETLGVCSYVLAGHAKGNLKSSEAGFKYVLYGAAASGVLLYGLTFLYGMAGTTTLVTDSTTTVEIFDRLGVYVANGLFPGGTTTGEAFRQVSVHLLPIPFLMVLAGLLYKVAVFPFHFWAPDVYEGAPMPVTAIFSVLVKIAGFAAFIRFTYGWAGGVIRAVQERTDVGAVGFAGLTSLLAILAAVTMTIGNLSALNQTNIKRMLAYSGIANAGYILMGACVLTSWGDTGYDVEGVFASLFFMTVYLFANLGAFVVAIAVADHLGKEDINDYAGLGRLVPILGVSMAIFLFSLIGLPPFAGFIGKFYLFFAVIRHGLYTLAIVAVLNSVVSVFYYVRILKLMFLNEPPKGLTFDISTHYKAVLWMLMIPVIVLGVYFGPLSDVARTAARVFAQP